MTPSKNTKREIKFRAWQYGEMMYMPNVLYGIGQFGFTNEHYTDLSLHDNEPTELMQFTGLTDKNGVDVYEGDIVKKWDTHRGNDWRDSNVFCTEGPIEFVSGQFVIMEEGCPESLLDIYHPQLTTMEVIGNIYENPELLTKEVE